MVMEEIARFHALGYHYLKSYPGKSISHNFIYLFILKKYFFSGGTDEGRKKNEVFVTDFVYANPVKLLIFCGKSGKQICKKNLLGPYPGGGDEGNEPRQHHAADGVLHTGREKKGQ